MNKTTKIEIGSTWTGLCADGETRTLTVLSLPIPGNELRHVRYADGKESVVGCNWFKRAIANHGGAK